LATELLTRLSPRLFSLNVAGSGETPAVEACQSVHDLLYLAGELRRKEMFCLSLTGEVKKKEAVSLVTGRLVPILIIDAGGGLAAEGPTVDYEAVVSLPFRAFLAGMMSIPWPKARPLDVRGFISVVGTTSITPRAEDQLRRISLALLSENYMKGGRLRWSVVCVGCSSSGKFWLAWGLRSPLREICLTLSPRVILSPDCWAKWKCWDVWKFIRNKWI